MKRSTSVLAALILFIGVGQVKASMLLTTTAISEGFTLSTFATGFPDSPGIGPIGIAFPSTGGVLVGDYANGGIYQFASDTDGQTASTHVGNYGQSNASGLAVD